MTLLTIRAHPDPCLRKVAARVAPGTPGLAMLAADMLETMYHAAGIGLSAPQVGESKRLIVMDCKKGKNGKPHPMVLINPIVIRASMHRAVCTEGCLSIPGTYGRVERPAKVTVRWRTLEGLLREESFIGRAATCVQHETDHLDGILFIDYRTPVTLLRLGGTSY